MNKKVLMATLAVIIFLLVPYTSVAIDEELEPEITLQCDYCETLGNQLIYIKEQMDAAKEGCEIFQRWLDCLRFPILRNEFIRLLNLWYDNCEGPPPVTIPSGLGVTVVNTAPATVVTTSTTTSSSGCNCPCGQVTN